MSDQTQTLPSERSFGLLFGVVFALLAGYGWLFKGWSLVVALLKASNIELFSK